MAKATQKKKKPIVKKTVEAKSEETKPVETATEKIEEEEKIEESVEVEKTDVKAVKAVKVQDPEEHFKLNGKKMYWNNKVSISTKGIVHGAVLVGDMKTFFMNAPKGIELLDWMSDFDPIAKREKAAREKMKRKIGLKE